MNKGLLGRLLGFDADERKRFWLHFPIGCIAAWMTYELAPLGLMAMGGFLFYEALQDWRKVDKSYKDVIGPVFGYIIVGAVLLILSKVGVI